MTIRRGGDGARDNTQPLPQPVEVAVPVIAERVNHTRETVERIETALCNFIDEQRERDEKRAASEKSFSENLIDLGNKMIIVGQRSDAAHARIDGLEKWRISVDKLMPLLRVEAWFFGLVSLPLLGWLIAVIYEWLKAKITGVIP